MSDHERGALCQCIATGSCDVVPPAEVGRMAAAAQFKWQTDRGATPAEAREQSALYLREMGLPVDRVHLDSLQPGEETHMLNQRLDANDPEIQATLAAQQRLEHAHLSPEARARAIRLDADPAADEVAALTRAHRDRELAGCSNIAELAETRQHHVRLDARAADDARFRDERKRLNETARLDSLESDPDVKAHLDALERFYSRGGSAA